MINRMQRIIVTLCVIGLLGISLVPGSVYTQSTSKKQKATTELDQAARVCSPEQKAKWDALPTQVDLVKLEELKQRVGELSQDEALLLKKWVDIAESQDSTAELAKVLAPPANDVCASATVVAALPFMSTEDPTAEATTAVTDPLIPCTILGPAQHSRTVWLTYTPPTRQTITIDLSASTKADTVLAVWCGSPATACPTPTTLKACDDDSGVGFTSRVTFRAVASEPLLIELADFGGPSTGNYGVSITAVVLGPGPANDNCQNATVVSLPAGGGVFMECVSTVNGTNQCGEQTTPCFGSGPSVWYKVTAGKTGTLDVGTFGFVPPRTSTNYDTVVAVYNTSTCVPTGATLTACNDDFLVDDFFRSRVVINVTVGQTVLVRVSGFGGDSGTACVRFVNQ